MLNWNTTTIGMYFIRSYFLKEQNTNYITRYFMMGKLEKTYWKVFIERSCERI